MKSDQIDPAKLQNDLRLLRFEVAQQRAKIITLRELAHHRLKRAEKAEGTLSRIRRVPWWAPWRARAIAREGDR